ncbi:BTB/POZ domain-containing protein [Aspergillus homomorphus CBS 101889]|uniref:BTB domain-containing protein n=1 Tax=Aspergillus homomorphus (strain CBS 101889) TaxID=1450537 RepID=A0A395HIR2_ASPHC|nr:hypothetical protein BO97DRAFT_401325 [Aspergillus homomorphus CBS 101889]RAL06798.1 hypothetical protein BO97DRAFT_401325 [Aspergillus homomorphus CBS 101889]
MSVEEFDDSTPHKQPNLESFDSEGDLILAIEGRDIRQFLVSSKVLRLASPVFRKLLSPKFREGMQMTESHCPIITLHDDDSECMETMLKVLHYQEEENQMNAEMLARLAVLCDKYDCNRALRPWVFKWFHDCQTIRTAEENGLLLLAAHFFRDEDQFCRLSANAQTQLSLEFGTQWQENDLLKLLPAAAWNDLSDRIEELLQKMTYELQSIEEALRNNQRGYEMDGLVCACCGKTHPIGARKCHSCRNDQLSVKHCTGDYRVAEYFSALRKLELWPSVQPFRICSAETIAMRISRVKTNLRHGCGAGKACPLELEVDFLGRKVNGFLGKVKGLKLYPLQQNNEQYQ